MAKKRKGKKGLTPKQQNFVNEYLTNLNATQAAKDAGYSEKTANEIGAENLAKPSIQTAIQRAMDERAERTNVRADNVILELATIAFSDINDFLEIDSEGVVKGKILASLPEGATRAIKKIKQKKVVLLANEKETLQSVTLEFELWDKPKSLELLGKHLKLWLDRKEITGKDGGPIQVENNGLDLSQLTDDEFDEFRALATKSFKRLGSGEGSGSAGQE